MAAAERDTSELATRIAASLVMIAVAVLITYVGGLPFRILAAAAAAMMLLEWGDMHRVPRLWTWLGVVLMGLPLIGISQYYFPIAAHSPLLLLPEYFHPSLYGFAALAAAGALLALLSRRLRMGWGLVYIGAPAFALIVLNWAWAELVLWLFVVVWATDIFAFFAGRAIGGPKLAPRVSPNKTWAGLAGGIVGAALVGWGAGLLLGIEPAFFWLGAPLGLIAQLGDLYESAVKRRVGVKDSGRIIPGHGGVLDRLDGLLPAALATYAVLVGLAAGHL
ncbi:MAG: phosphatidate cytidylyltransferase [Pseudomonadota bacterium]|nr:phosphatidate cytidylyltransferase [Pseudomonadota bacterium]